MNDIHTADAPARHRHLAGSIDRPGHPIDRITEATFVGAIGDREELR